MASPTYQIEVAWTGRLTGVFTIGTSTIGGTDVIAGVFGGNAFDDITSDVRAFSVSRGRAHDMSLMLQGRATLRLYDATGKYNPENASSSLNGYLVPMRPVRIRATHSSTTYGMFYGYISRIEHDPGTRTSTIEAVDFFEWLAVAKPTISEKTNNTVNQLIGHILDAVGWTDPSMRSLGTSNSTVPTWSLAGGTAALSAIQILLTVDLGMFFIDGDGIATYLSRNTRYANGAPAATLSDTVTSGLKASVEKDRIINGQSCTKTGSTTQTSTDTASRQSYGYRDGSPIDSAYLQNDAQALSLAQFIVAVNKDPRPPARELLIQAGDDTRLTQQLAREVGDLVTVSEAGGGTAFNGRIQALRHDLVAPDRLLESRLMVQKVTAAAFTIGTSTIGGSDIIAY